MDKKYGIREILQPDDASSSKLAKEDFQFPAPKQLNDYVYEVCKPRGRPSVEIVFFHGVPLEDSSSKDPHVITWVCRDRSELWLNWLPEGKYLSDARILTISYDASPWMMADRGMMDMYCTRENLIPTLTGHGAEVGQDGCPVVLVGHCLGGLVMKEVCVQAHLLAGLIRPDKPNQPVQNLLHNIKGLFTYASPHHGSCLADSNTRSQKGVLFEGLTTQNTDAARRNEDFRKLRELYKWKTSGVGERLPVFLESLNFKGRVVEEASARQDLDAFYTVDADHFTVCRPFSRMCSSFQLLSSFVSKVVEEDKARLSSNIRLLTEPKIVGLQARVMNVVKKLEGKQRLGIVGIGGIGKTTLAKALFDEISWKFEYVCFLEEVKTKMAKEETSDHLRAKIIEGLKWKGRDVDKDFKWISLQAKTVLIILDGAKYESQVMVMLESDKFSEESRLVVTSRQGKFLRKQGFEIHDTIALDLDDSKKLLCLHVFGQLEVPERHKEDMTSFVTSFAQKCGGLPLALKVSGSFLSNHIGEDALWDEALKKLRTAEPLNGDREDGLWSILRVSYEDLPTSEQEMFLDVATCFHMTDLEEVQEAWTACSWASPLLGWDNLLDRCLVTVDDNRKISMHETLRDMGRNLAGHSRVCITRVANQLRQKKKATVKVLKIHRYDDDDYYNVDYNVLSDAMREKATTVKVCKRVGSHPYSFISADTSDDDDDDNYRYVDNGVLYGWKELQILWLDIIVPRLERIGELQELRQLKLESLWRLKQPKNVRDRSFSFLKCSRARDFRKLPKSIGKLRKLRYLEIANCDSLETLPSTIGELCALEHLRIRACESLTKLPESIGQLQALRHLEIHECRSLKALPDNIGNLRALKHLEIKRCENLRELPEYVGSLSKLWHLEIGWCTSLKSLPDNIGNLRALKRLKITDCENLRELPESVGKLSELWHLEIRYLENLRELPESIGKLSELRHLEISLCTSLKSLPSTIGNLRALKHLVITYCEKLSEIPESVGKLSELRHLEIKYRKTLTELPESDGELSKSDGELSESDGELSKSDGELSESDASKLSEMLREECPLQCFKSSAGLSEEHPSTTTKERLKSSACPSEERSLPHTLGQLHKLEPLIIWGHDDLKEFPESSAGLSEEHPSTTTKERLKSSACPSEERPLLERSLPHTLGQLHKLETLIIWGHDDLKEFPEFICQLRALRHLEFWRCTRLKNFPEYIQFGQLKELRHLRFEHCDRLETPPSRLLEQLHALEELVISWCPRIIETPEWAGQHGVQVIFETS